MQSPIGLVPKANRETRLIFHLSYDFPGRAEPKSINSFIPKKLCMVKYRDLDHAILQCLDMLKENPNMDIFYGICDLKSAFRMVPLLRKCWPLLTVKARDNQGQVEIFC